MAAAVGQLLTMRYSREHELQADRLAALYGEAGYPRSLIDVMNILAEAGGALTSGILLAPIPIRKTESKRLKRPSRLNIQMECPMG